MNPSAMVPANRQPLDFSKTQRLVLLIDLDPILTLQNPSPYFSTVISAANRLLCFPPLSAALSAFKFFFSSLSPLRSASALPRQLSTPSLSFNIPSETLSSLSTTLNCISTLTDLPNAPFCPRASYAASSLLQLAHDYAWEIEQDKILGGDRFSDGSFVRIPSNLVILFSPIGQSVNSVVDYLGLREFNDAFCVVREAFAIRDIHLCWVDVNIDESDIVVAYEKEIVCREILAAMRDGIKNIGWGFCSSDLIVFCSVLLPLGLIYPKIGVPSNFIDFGGRKYSGELNLQILDVDGMPLDCKFCNLEFVKLKRSPCTVETHDIFNGSESRDVQSFYGQDEFRTLFGEGTLKLHVKNVHSYNVYENTGRSSDTILVRECCQELQKNKRKIGESLFTDRVLEMLHGEMDGVTCRNQLPTWQIFLSFLYTKGCWALISLSSSNGDTFMGSLKPFTAHLAILHIFDTGHVSHRGKSGFDGITRHTSIEEMNDSNTCPVSQTDASTSGNCKQHGDGKRQRSRRHLYQEMMTWSSFRKAAFEGSNFDLFEVYSTRYFEKYKKLKFFKCWMKHISKVEQSFLKQLPRIKSMEETSACNALLSKSSPVQEEVMPVSKVETLDDFLGILSKRIHHGLESGMDLQKLAERIVTSSIQWLHQKCENESNIEGQKSMRNSDDPSSVDVGEKLIELLLRSPKEMKKIHQDPSSSSSEETTVREYELQILLRMEILCSDVAAMMGESRKMKLLKQICSLLEIIQFLVAGGGIHGHVSLYDYVERNIMARYSDKLEDVVKKIYTEMDLLPFGEEDEAPSLLFNSEDSNHSWRDKHDRNDKAEGNSLNHSVSTEGESSQPFPNAYNSQQESKMDDYTRSLNEARERRERARRFAPFVSKALDLQRVWAPKQTKAMKCKYDPRPSKSKRKDRLLPSYSVVCETPMTGNKRSCSRARARARDLGNSTSSSVSKALFQDN